MKIFIIAITIPVMIFSWSLRLSWNKTLDAHTFSATGIYDIDGDSMPELLVPGNRTLYCLRSINGDTIWTFTPFSNYFPAVSSPIAADIDRDGSIEVIVNSPNYLYILNSAGRAKWSFLLPNPGSVQNCISSAALGDINRDGKYEVFVCAPYNNTLYCLEPDSGKERWHFTPSPASRFIISTPTVVDLNLDHRYEILIGTADDAGGRLFCLNDSGRVLWSYQTTGSGISGWQITSACVGDINGDDTLEVFMTSNYWGIFCVNHRGQERWVRRLNEHSSSYPAVGDIDGNGTLEVIAGFGPYLTVFNGSNGNTLWADTVLSGYYIVSSPGLADFNGDGLIEIAYGELKQGAPNDSTRLMWVLSHRGVTIWSDTVGTTFSDPTIGDIDRDGRIEMTIGPTYRGYKFWTFETDTITQIGRIEWQTLQHDIQRTGLYGFRDTTVIVAELPESSLKSGFKIWPNPARHYVEFQIERGRKHRIKIFDISGRDVAEIYTNNSGRAMLSTDGLPSGVYFAVVGQDIKRRQKLILVQ